MGATVLDLPATGGCRCGACRYSFDSAPFVAYTCHCRDCQKLTGSAFLTCLHIAAEALELTAGESVVDERPTDSGNLVRTHFCLRCGGSLYARNSARPRMILCMSGRWIILNRSRCATISGQYENCHGSSFLRAIAHSLRAVTGGKNTRGILRGMVSDYSIPSERPIGTCFD